ncbi:hypothetical protein FHR84_004174 [Actinopolyspora biskrensis]|uniref:Glycoprotein n=1 Tax=Actinopolyspora biskrensis TaxID=1470178 RepID=A0A852ZBB2_9ACTN|nr:DUF6049 family protein [Actinopolyspora biskrensis]NYH80806.1 hypothetical protein [Actinopolyspora biskrensis]
MSPQLGGAHTPENPVRVRTWTKAALVAVIGVLLTAFAPAAPEATAQPGEQVGIDVSSVTPEVVRSGSEPFLEIAGTLRNNGDEAIDELEMRLERGEPRATRPSLVEAMRGGAKTSTRTRFTTVADNLAPGQRTSFELRVELKGTGPQSLGLERPGVYPLLLNVNGDLAPQRRARVGSANFMLPVLSLPGGSTEPPSQSTGITTLIPLVDYPHMAQEQLPGRPTILTDDRLAKSLAPGGRLSELVDAVSEEVPADSELGKSVCFAIDPDLIVTAKAMAEGYQVREQSGETVRGTGSRAAADWLNRLRETVGGRCVLSLPYSDADLVALARAGLPDLIRGSMDGSGLISSELGVAVRDDVLWPADGALDRSTASQLADTPVRSVLMHPDSLAGTSGTLRPVRLNTGNPDYAPTARKIDPLVADALNPARGQQAGGSTGLAPAGDGMPSVLDGLAALTFRANTAAVEGGTIIAPPRRWNPDGAELRGFLSGLRSLGKAGYVRPEPLPSAESGDTGGDSSADTSTSSTGEAPQRVSPTYPASSERAEIPPSVLDELAAQNYKVGQLYSAAEREPALNVDPARVTTPLRNGLLHGASSAWRGNGEAASHWVDVASRTLEGVLDGVHTAKFEGQITLTSSQGKILVTVQNDLPVNVRFKLHVDSPPGVQVDDLGVLKVPANGSRLFLPETTVERSGKFTVDVTLRTEGGAKLGQTRRLRVDSNAYGTVPLILTITAAALLVLLSARRIVRRIRSRGNGSGDGGSTGGDGTDPNGPGDSPDTGETEATPEEDNPAPSETSPDEEAPRPGGDGGPPERGTGEPATDNDPRRS